jgi:hypothetical protein
MVCLYVCVLHRERCQEAQSQFLQRCFYQAVSHIGLQGLLVVGTGTCHMMQSCLVATTDSY